MFVNAAAVGIVVRVLVATVLLLCLALVSHVVWLDRLARSPVLGRLGPAGRVAVLALAAVMPVVGFYGVGIVLGLRRLARRRGRAVAAVVAVGAVAALAFLVAALASPAMPGAPPPDVLSRSSGIVLVLAVPCAVLGMACQVLPRSNRARVAWVVGAGVAAACLILFV